MHSRSITRWLWEDGGPLVSYATAIIAFAACGLIFFGNIRFVREEEQRVTQTYEVLSRLHGILEQMATAEAGQRLFLLTEDPSLLQNYHVGLASISEKLRELSRLIADQPQQLEQLRRVEQLVEKRLELLDENVASVSNGQRAETQQRLRSSSGTLIMLELRSQIAVMEDRERQLLTQRRSNSDSAYFRAVLSGVLAASLGLSLVLASLIYVNGALQRKRAAEGELRRQLSQLRLLSEVVSRLGSVHDVASVMGTAPHEIRLLIPCELALLQVNLPRQQKQLTYAASLGECTSAALATFNELLEIGERHGTASVLLDSDQVRERLSPDQRWPSDLWPPGQRINLLRVPLIDRQRQIIGSLQLMGKFNGDFTEHDRLLSIQFAYAIGISLQNAKLMEQLHQGDQRKTDFLAVLGHELRNPLAGVLSGIDALKFVLSTSQSPLPETSDAAAMIATVSRQATHMVRLVDDLLDVSRIERGKILLRRSRVNLEELLKSVVADFRATQPPTRQVILNCAAVQGKSPCIQGDSTRLSQCFANLLVNAAKFSPVDAPISIMLRHAENPRHIWIDIQDQGIGLASEDQQDIFEAFHQLAHAEEYGANGLGLGLALVKGIVSLHNGEVMVTSEGLQKGSTFSVRLPLSDEPAPDKSPTDTPNQTPTALVVSTARILLIDDRRDSLLPLKVLLSRDGHTVKDASNGSDGLAIAREFQPEVVLCDIGLPGGMNGYDVARAIRREDSLKGCYLVAISGFGQSQDLRDAEAAGFDYHLTKPASQAQLRATLVQRPRFNGNLSS